MPKKQGYSLVFFQTCPLYKYNRLPLLVVYQGQPLFLISFPVKLWPLFLFLRVALLQCGWNKLSSSRHCPPSEYQGIRFLGGGMHLVFSAYVPKQHTHEC